MNTAESTELTRLLTERAGELHVEPDLDGVARAAAPTATGGGGNGGRRAYLVAAAAAVVVIGIGGVLVGVPTTGQSSGGSTPIFQIDAAFAQPAAGEVIVWLDPEASAAAVEAVELRLVLSTDVERAVYVPIGGVPRPWHCSSCRRSGGDSQHRRSTPSSAEISTPVWDAKVAPTATGAGA